MSRSLRSIQIDEIDPAALADSIAAAVVAAMRPIITEAAEPRLVDRARMRELLGVSMATLDNLVAEGIIPSRRIGSRRLFEPARVIESLPHEMGAESQ